MASKRGQGHLAYYAVPGNTDAVAAFRTQATRHWYRALRRRSQRTRLNWERMRGPAHIRAKGVTALLGASQRPEAAVAADLTDLQSASEGPIWRPTGP